MRLKDPGAIVAAPNGRHLYMVDHIELIAWRVDANRGPDPIDIEVPRGGRPSALAISPNGQWLFGTHPSSNSVSV